ncbi:putative ribonuclease H-like domain-containing protein [Tanacetum coccineum]
MSQPANDDFSQHLSDDEASYHEDASENGTATNKPKQQQQLIPTTTTISNIKLPILKKEEYDIWAMEMEHYLEYIDNDVWKKIHAVEKERKARTILLMAIPKEHLRRFHGMDDAKEIWEAIRTSKSITNKVKSGYTGAYSTCTPTSSNNIQEREVPAGFADEVIYSLFAKQSEDLDLLHEDLEQIDDVDIKEMDIKWQIAMIAIRMKKLYKKTGRRVRIDGNKPVGFDKKKLECFKCFNTGHFAGECPSNGTNDGKKRGSFYQDQGAGEKEQNQNLFAGTMADGVVNGEIHYSREEERNHALMAISSQILRYHYLGEQEAKILAYTLAVKKLEAQIVTFQKQQLSLNEQLTFQANEIYAKDEKLKRYRRIGMKAVKEKEQLKKTVDSWKDSSKNLWKLIDSGMSSTSKVGLGYEIKSNNEVLSYEEEMNRSVFKCTAEDYINKPLYSRFTKTNSFKGVPHPLTGDYTPKPQEEIDDSLYVYGKKGPQKPEISDSDDNSTEHSTCQSNDSEGSCGNTSEHSSESESESISVPNEMSTSKSVITNAKVVSESKEVEPSCAKHVKTPMQQMKNQGTSEKIAREAEFKKQRVFNTGNRVAKPVWTNANRVNHANQFVPRSVQLNAGRPNINSVRPNINTGRTNVNSVRPRVNNWETGALLLRPQHVIIGGTLDQTRIMIDHPLKNMEDRGIFDSGCSGHMTGNKDHLDDFEECKGGSVTFGGSKGYITGKGRIKVGNLEFDSVSFVKELGHFNLFSISQICDKQHKVLFTKTECLVVTPDFKMPDENQILLKVPRQHNMYSFDMKTPGPAKSFACLIAKATSDESKLWHRRLGHINFKNLNKLVKGNLVRGLPSKVFKNDHTCVACQKGKQHRASCKAKLERMITEPLHTLHMDLFGPTSVKSINHASYCLVITDDCTRFSWVFFLATKDETSGILQNFIRQIENQLNHRVKIIRSDNGTEFKNRDMLEFCGNKGIKQEYSNARTPQQNGVAKRMNKTLIEAARTMLADSLLPTTFWAEAVSTACYIFNRVRVTKPQNKTPYELLFGHKPIISYIRPFGCHVTILDTLSVLGKFDGKCDEGFLVGYSLNSKAFRVYNLVTKKVEVNLHVKFLEEKPNVKGVEYRWMFDIDYLTDSMNYIPVSLENPTNPNAGTSEVTTNVGTLQNPNANASEEEDKAEDLIVVPTSVKHIAVKVGPRKSSTISKVEEFVTELQNLKTQEKEAYSTSISEDTPEILPFRRELDDLAQKHLKEVPKNKATNPNSVNSGSGQDNTQPADQDDSDTPELIIFNKPQQGIFDEASYDDEGMFHNFNNLLIEVAVSPIPTLRIHNIYPQSQILGDPKSSVQTRSKVQQHSKAHALVIYVQKQQRNNHKDQQHCLFACFLSHEEPKKISKALQDDSWVEAMQEELLQFRLQQVWILVDLPHGAKVIGTKWVYRNKRDERGVVVRNKARLVAQGHRQEEGIDYDEVFAPVARIEAIRYAIVIRVEKLGSLHFENDIKGLTASSSSTQNVAFVSKNTSSTNDVSTAYSVSNTSGQNLQYEQTSSYSLLANQSSCPQLDHENLEQLDEFDLEEMDLKWQVAMISMRMKKFYKKTGRKLQFDAKEPVGFDIKNKDWTRHSEEEEDYALMACNSSGSDTEVTSCSNECKESYAKLKKLYDAQREQLSDASIEIKAYTQGLKKVEAQLVAHQQGQLWYEEKIRFMKIDLDDKIDVLTYHKKLLAEAQKEKEDLKAKVEKWHNSSKNLSKLLNTQISTNDKFGLGYRDHRYDGILSYENEVLQSVFMNKERNYMPYGPDVEIDYSQFTYGPKQSQPSESETQTSDFDTCESDCSVETHESLPEPTVNEPKVENQPKVRSDAPIIEEYESDSEDEHVSQPTKEQEQPSFASTNKQVKTPRETVKNQFTHSKNPTVDKKGLGYGFTARACFVCGSLSHLIRDCDFHEKRMAKQAELNNSMRMKSSQREIRPIWNNVQRVNHKNQFVPTAVLTRTGKILVNTARASGTNKVSTARASGTNKVSTARHDLNRQAVLTNAAMKVNTVQPIVNRVRPANVFYRTHSPFSRSFNNTTALRTNFSHKKVNTAEVNAVSAVGGKRETAVKPSAGCNWRQKGHYWQNISKYNSGSSLRNCFTFKDPLGRLKPKQAWAHDWKQALPCCISRFNGGPVAFRICDKKNKVLFTDSECLVLSPEFKLPDENQNLRTGILLNYVGQKGSRGNTVMPNSQQMGVADRKEHALMWATRPMLADSFLLTLLGLEAGSVNLLRTTLYCLYGLLILQQSRDQQRKDADFNRQEKGCNDAAEASRRSLAQENEVLLLQVGVAKASCLIQFNIVSTPVSTASPYDGLSFPHPTYPDQDDSENPMALNPKRSLKHVKMKVRLCYAGRMLAVQDSESLGFFGRFALWEEQLEQMGRHRKRRDSYDEVFALVARIEAIRIFLAFASYMGFIVYQMDVKSAFLYGKIDEEVYVSQPPGFIDPKYPQKVYKVVKALYGLHQAPRAWYATLSTFLLNNGYKRGTIDKTLFIKKDKHDIILVQVYVDDIIFGSTKKSWCDEFEALMKSRFQMSSMGELTFFLGLQVKQKEDGIFISQDKPDIMFASVLVLVSGSLHQKTSHLSAVKRIFRYLKGKPKLGLWYPRVSSFDLEAYSDSDYAGANLDRKSTTGGCQFLGRRLISWQCKKQTIVATSTTEAEYVAAANCCGQVLWIQNQMLDYGFNFMNTKIYIDNESTICIVKNPVYHSKTKHIAISDQSSWMLYG